MKLVNGIYNAYRRRNKNIRLEEPRFISKENHLDLGEVLVYLLKLT